METAKRLEIKSTKPLRDLMAQHFLEIDEAVQTKKRKVAWCTSVGPAELLVGMGFLVYYPENHGAMLGSTRVATDAIPAAVANGYSPEICSYLTSDIGAFLKGETPLTKAYGIKSIPKPDVLVYNTNQCRDVYDWFRFYSEKWNVPLFGINTPQQQPMLRDDVIKLVSSQLQEMVPGLEKIAGQKFDIDKFREVIALSKECSDLWSMTLDTASAIPAPLTFWDACIHMGPAVVMRGRKEANDYYKLHLLPELKERVKEGVAAIDGEKHRFYWEGMPIWGKLRNLSELFARLKVNVVASTYCSSWIFSALDPKDPFESMARAYASIFITLDDKKKEAYMQEKIKHFGIDGVIYHDAKTCPNNTNCRHGLSNRLTKMTGVPNLVINGDLNDLRCYSEEQSVTNIEAFVEQIEENKVTVK